MVTPEVVIVGKCEDCGTDVRDGSQFCYHCGRGIQAEPSQKNKTSTFSSTGPGMKAPEQGTMNGSNSESERKKGIRRRRLPKRTEGPVQVVWRREERPSYGFLLIALGVTIVAIGLTAMAYYLH
ncbi:MAG: hypothetical protein DMF62_12295 [Acidobacteria bacterium]|nr:MAG: hypothetical protein DMF62_12295 [Acidobacteriota bacterium]